MKSKSIVKSLNCWYSQSPCCWLSAQPFGNSNLLMPNIFSLDQFLAAWSAVAQLAPRSGGFRVPSASEAIAVTVAACEVVAKDDTRTAPNSATHAIALWSTRRSGRSTESIECGPSLFNLPLSLQNKAPRQRTAVGASPLIPARGSLQRRHVRFRKSCPNYPTSSSTSRPWCIKRGDAPTSAIASPFRFAR